MTETEQLALRLTEFLKQFSSAIVAYSGGVDSAVVAMAAYRALSDRAIAVTAVSPSVAQDDLRVARSQAQQIGIRHQEIRTEEFARPDYRSNSPSRCYFCKQTLYVALTSMAREMNIDVLLNGTNADDLSDYRPGLQAASEFRVISPLAELGMTKADVRAVAELWHLQVHNKPASPCLSSRIAWGVEVTEERVRRVEQAEKYLRSLLNCGELRVRLEASELARIEVPATMVESVVRSETRQAISQHLRELGFLRVTLDLEGFRSGSMNDGLVTLKSPTASGISS